MKSFTGRCFKDNNSKYILVIEDIKSKSMLKTIEIEPLEKSIKINKFFCYRNLDNSKNRADGITFTEIEKEEFIEVYEAINIEISQNIIKMKKRYERFTVIDYYENPFGDRIYTTQDKKDAEEFCRMFEEDTDGECNLTIKEEDLML